MMTGRRFRATLKTLALMFALALPAAMVTISEADARAGGGRGMGSRGSRTFSAPPPTSTAPNAARPFERSITQPGSNMGAAATTGAAAKGGFFNRPGMGLMGGLAAGFLGAGLFGMLFGGGFLSGLGSFAGMLGFILQIVLLVIVARLAWGWWQRRNGNAPASAYAGGPAAGRSPADGPLGGNQANFDAPRAPRQDGAGYTNGNAGSGFGFGRGNTPRPIQIGPDDYEAFERLLGEVQAAWSDEDVEKLHKLATPEMVSYFAQDLASNKSRGVVNKVTGIKLLQGDLAEAWNEGNVDYATVALRFEFVDKTLERSSGRIVEGSESPQQAVEIWTFTRPSSGGDWELSGIQQSS